MSITAAGISLTDGSNVAAVKAGNVAPAAGDAALVVTLSPNGGGGGGGGASMADNALFTEGTTVFTPVGGEYNTAPGSPTNGNAAACQITIGRGLHINLRNAAGTEIATVAAPASVRLSDGTNQSPTFDAAARSGFVQITDGTRVGTVKAASTAAVATDTATVVAISPNIFGQATMANSLPVALASNQFAVAGAAIAGNPVTIGGWDGANAQWLSVDSANAAKVKPKSLYITGTGASANDTPIPSTDVSDYRVVVVSLLAVGTNTVLNFEVSPDGSSGWIATAIYRIDTSNVVTAPNINGFAAGSAFLVPITNRYFRVRQTSSVATNLGAYFSSSPAQVVPARIQLSGGASGDTATAYNFDAGNNATFGTTGPAVVATSSFNATNWDRLRNNTDVSLLASAARTTTTNSSDQTNYNGRTLALFVNVSSAGTGSITPSIQVKDSISGDYFTIWTAAAALTANGDYVYNFADGASGGSFTESKPFGLHHRTWRLQMVANNANSVTYSTSGITGV